MTHRGQRVGSFEYQEAVMNWNWCPLRIKVVNSWSSTCKDVRGFNAKSNIAIWEKLEKGERSTCVEAEGGGRNRMMSVEGICACFTNNLLLRLTSGGGGTHYRMAVGKTERGKARERESKQCASLPTLVLCHVWRTHCACNAVPEGAGWDGGKKTTGDAQKHTSANKSAHWTQQSIHNAVFLFWFVCFLYVHAHVGNSISLPKAAPRILPAEWRLGNFVRWGVDPLTQLSVKFSTRKLTVIEPVLTLYMETIASGWQPVQRVPRLVPEDTGIDCSTPARPR